VGCRRRLDSRNDATGSKQFFFAKKNQKTLIHKARAVGQRTCQMCKSFLVLFCKKELLSFVPAMTAESLCHPGLATRHGFFTRRGGVSVGPYASLNANLSGGDDPAHVAANRALVAQALGVDPAALLGCKQVHGTTVITVTEPWPAGQGAAADALVTRQAGLALGVITADCAPVLFHDARAGVIGAAHAGWRGAAAGVLEATITAMRALGAATGTITAVVGPCIAQASYEVGPDLRDAVLPTLTNAEAFFGAGRPPDRFQFDLAGYCLARLRAAGIGHTHGMGVDTFADAARFFSHRRRTLGAGGPIGHQISAITL
jgi:YfiH family protein